MKKVARPDAGKATTTGTARPNRRRAAGEEPDGDHFSMTAMVQKHTKISKKNMIIVNPLVKMRRSLGYTGGF